MRNFLFLILIIILLGCISGCEEPAKKRPDVPIEGIKIGDLIPKHSEKLPSAINFKIFTFQIPAANYSRFSGAFDSLSKKMMRFSNDRAFRVNGFAAGLGNTKSFQTVGEYLKKAEARRTKLSSLIAYEYVGEEQYQGNDFLVGNIPANTLTSYFDISINSKEMNLGPGLLCWRINAHETGSRRGAVQVKIQGLFKPGLGSAFSRVKEYDTGERIFKPSSMVMKMDEGDFVLIGPKPHAIYSKPTKNNKGTDASSVDAAIKPISLAELFFLTHGNMILPKTSKVTGKEALIEEIKDKEEKTETTEKVQKEKTDEDLYKLVKDIDIVEVFLIINLGVGN